MAGTIDSALDLYGNALRGTASQRAAFLSTAVDGMLWQDTDGIRMIWRKDGALWVPAVWRWRGTTAQMNSFGANAPDGFEWFSTTNNSSYVRLGGAWSKALTQGVDSGSFLFPGASGTYTLLFKAGAFTAPPTVVCNPITSDAGHQAYATGVTETQAIINYSRTNNTNILWIAVQS